MRDRFQAAGIAPDDISFERATWTFRLDGPPAELMAIFRDYYGPTMNAFEAAAKNGHEDALAAELTDLFEQQNFALDHTAIPATFLKVSVIKS